MTEHEFCYNVLKGAWWFYKYAEPQIKFYPYCGKELNAGLVNEIHDNRERENV